MKIRITVTNGNYPLTRECSTISEAYGCMEALKTGLLHDISIDMDHIMIILVGMQEGDCLEVDYHRYAIKKIEDCEVPA